MSKIAKSGRSAYLMGMERPEPTTSASFAFCVAFVVATNSSLFFLEGVKRFDLLRLFLEVVGVEEGVAKSLLFSLFSTE